MPGRITSSILSSDYLRNMRRNLSNMRTLQNQLATGKEIQNVSDNPYKASRSMQINTEISYNKQYNENIKDTSNWLDTTDTALAQVGNVFGRIEQLLVSAGNAAYGTDERTAIQDEIKEKVNELSQILNTSFDGSYIFGGTKTGSKPTTVVNGVLQYANTLGKAINVYNDAAGNVTSNSVYSNTKLDSTTPIYLDSNGKITTSATNNTQIIQGSSLYVDITSPVGVTTGLVSTVAGANSNPLLLKDELYVDPTGNITAERTTENALINSDNELFYLTSDGKVTTTYNSTYTLITTGTPLYKDAYGQVTISGTSQNQITAATPIYKNAAGYVTTSSITVNSALPSTTGSVNTLTVSNYDPATGYTSPKPTIDPSCNIYKDSRGILTNLSTTDLINRKATLKELWTNAYIDSTDQKVKTTAPIPVPNNQLNLYKDSNGYITTSPGGYPANEQILLGTNLYKDSTGKVTTNASAGTQLELTNTVYVDLNGQVLVSPAVTESGTACTVQNAAVSVRDTLSIDTSVTSDSQAKAVIGTPTGTNTAIPSDTITLYLDGTNNITNDINATNAQKIILSDSLYKDIHENITVFANSQNTLVDSDDKLYYDANGNVTNLASYTQVISGTTLYKDANGMVTTLHGEAPPNEAIDLTNVSLYKDASGNVTTKADYSGVANTLIDSKTSLYKDANGNITTVAKNTLIDSNTQLYKTDDGNSVTTKPSGSTFQQLMDNGVNLYRDNSGNVTTVAAGNTQITSANDFYEDSNGKIVTLPGEIMSGLINQGKLYKDSVTGMVTTAAAGNTQILSGATLYIDAATSKVTTVSIGNTAITSDPRLINDGTGNFKIAPALDQAQNAPVPSGTTLYIDTATHELKTRLIRSGDSMYADSNGKIVTLKAPQNSALAKSDVVYVDAAGNLTLSATTANEQLTMARVQDLKKELQSLPHGAATMARRIEINNILSSDDVIYLTQIDSTLTVDISQGVKTEYNKTAADILEFTDKTGKRINVSELLTNIIADLGSDKTRNNITTVDLKDIQSVTANLLQRRSEVGSMQNRMESAQANNEQENYSMTDILSKTEDIDWAEKTMEYSTMQTVYTSALQTSAKILPMTILTYL